MGRDNMKKRQVDAASRKANIDSLGERLLERQVNGGHGIFNSPQPQQQLIPSSTAMILPRVPPLPPTSGLLPPPPSTSMAPPPPKLSRGSQPPANTSLSPGIFPPGAMFNHFNFNQQSSQQPPCPYYQHPLIPHPGVLPSHTVTSSQQQQYQQRPDLQEILYHRERERFAQKEQTKLIYFQQQQQPASDTQESHTSDSEDIDVVNNDDEIEPKLAMVTPKNENGQGDEGRQADAPSPSSFNSTRGIISPSSLGSTGSPNVSPPVGKTGFPQSLDNGLDGVDLRLGYKTFPSSKELLDFTSLPADMRRKSNSPPAAAASANVAASAAIAAPESYAAVAASEPLPGPSQPVNFPLLSGPALFQLYPNMTFSSSEVKLVPQNGNESKCFDVATAAAPATTAKEQLTPTEKLKLQKHMEQRQKNNESARKSRIRTKQQNAGVAWQANNLVQMHRSISNSVTETETNIEMLLNMKQVMAPHQPLPQDILDLLAKRNSPANIPSLTGFRNQN